MGSVLPLNFVDGVMMMAEKKRNYRKEYDEYHGTEKQKSLRRKRNKARYDAVKKGLACKGDGKEVDHIHPLSKGGSNAPTNVQVVTFQYNRKKKDKTKA